MLRVNKLRMDLPHMLVSRNELSGFLKPLRVFAPDRTQFDPLFPIEAFSTTDKREEPYFTVNVSIHSILQKVKMDTSTGLTMCPEGLA
jgi:hypothetical protein